MKTEEKNVFRPLSPKARVRYILDYYKLPLFLTALVLLICVSVIHAKMSRKDAVLGVAAVNFEAGPVLTRKLSSDFLTEAGIDPGRNKINFAGKLVLTGKDEDVSGYAYASSLKIIAMIEARQMDVAIMNEKAYRIFLAGNYLQKLDPKITASLPKDHAVLSEEGKAVICRNNSGIFRDSGISGDLYLGIISNTAHPDTAASYLHYLLHGHL
jgi:ABC-type Fe3+ transport system substrate-binding protein